MNDDDDQRRHFGSTPSVCTMAGHNNKNKRRRKRPVPLVASVTTTTTATTAATAATAPMVVVMKSRKKARQVTTLFHKLTKDRDQAASKGDTHLVAEKERQIEAMGGRAQYQRASRLSTSFHSTSKWVLGQLAQNGWLYGIRAETTTTNNDEEEKKEEEKERADRDDRGDTAAVIMQKQERKRKRNLPRRTTRILEVGAINTELLDAAASAAAAEESKCNISVRAIDLHSMEPGRIEEYDFLKLPYCHEEDVSQRYDCIVCSMVINCVTTPEKRGEMLAKLYHHLRPGGMCFLTLPKFCLTKSAFLTPALFERMLGRTGVGFQVESTKESPRISFFILRRPLLQRKGTTTGLLDPAWTTLVVRNKGPKFPNQFSVVLDKNLVAGEDAAKRS